MMIRQVNQPNGARIHVLGLNIPEALAEVQALKYGSSADLIINVIKVSL